MTMRADDGAAGDRRRPAEGRREGRSLVRDLMRAEAYPQPRTGAAELQQTHASWVFLTDDEAWKVKRPVDFGFLDYSDAEKRRRCCEDEVALGRRLAPDVYLGVHPVYEGREGFSFLGPGTVVDHAVRMRRLPDEDSAASMLGSDRLTPLHLRRLAERLADFYAQCPVVAELGSPALLLANIRENHEQMAPFAGRFVDGGLIERVHDWQEQQVAALREHLAGRVAAGRIRDGHGDLRLEHVYFTQGRPDAPLVIDPIEFNRRLRGADEALDAAFLAMELDAANRPELSAWFLSCFAQATNDYDFFPVLDLYLSYRAWVRAKVACFVAADPQTPPTKAARKAAEAARLMALAASYIDRRPARPRPVIAVGGMIAAGKTTLAEALGLAEQLVVVSSDATRKHLGGLRATDPGHAALYHEPVTRRTYEELFRRAGTVVASGRGVVMDATFRDASVRAAAAAVARQAGGAGRPFLFVELACQEEVLRQRLRRRTREITVSDAREEQLQRFRREYRPASEIPDRMVLDGCQPLEALVRDVRGAIAAAGQMQEHRHP
jgi:aminoglycoside phosphotransferase family enzyme/predicted kinase